MSAVDFTEEQKNYLAGFAAGSGLARSVTGVGAKGDQPTFAGTMGLSAAQLPGGGPEAIHFAAQDKQVAGGLKLCPEEIAKRKRFPLDVWGDIKQHAAERAFPKKLDVLAFKYHGMFYVAPAQDSYMTRLRFPGGILPSFQLRRVADIAEKFGGGYADVTTRANLQIREITAADPANVLEALHEAGILNRGSGADNIRNITGSPTAGIDPQELIDTRSLSREMHHYILNHREMYGLPRKFNIAFDGGGVISSVADTNDIGFTAFRVGAGKVDAAGVPVEAGVYFRLALGGITGHKDFAIDEGVLLGANELISVAAAIVRVFIDHGDRTDRKKARLKYLLDRWGHEKFIKETETVLGRPMRRLALDQCEPRGPVDKHGHVGFHPQRQPGFSYAGVLLPVGRMTVAQMRGLAEIADRYGSGTLRLTVWQNLLVSDIPDGKIDTVKAEIEALGLSWKPGVRAGLIACTGAAGCKFAAAHTKQHALQLGDYLEARIALDQPVNIHLTGCPHSCAQHYMGDIGLIGTQVEVGEEMVEGYHVFVGGGYGADQAIGRELYCNVLAADLPLKIEQMLRGYLASRQSMQESFNEFVRRTATDALLEIFGSQNTDVHPNAN